MKKVIEKIGFLFLALLLLTFWACDSEDIVYQQDRLLETGSWSEQASMHFDVNVQDTTQAYNIFISLKNDNSYPRSNIWLFCKTVSPNGNFMLDTSEFIIADPHGRWIGAANGDKWDINILYKKAIGFPVKGRYQFEIQQAMRFAELPGIWQVGLRIEKTNFKTKNNND